MDFLTFRNHLFRLGCFNINQVLLWEKDFDRNNLTRWCKKGLLVKLKNEYYAFPEYRQVPDFARSVACMAEEGITCTSTGDIEDATV